ncbi:MAG: serine phosphatase RsbU (regulator of sigma subunit) [Crocinitomicaceae bacterium]|jgi:serine phosphatase RsbU (regulator of sigma subunit)
MRITLLIILLLSSTPTLFGQDTIVLNRNNLSHSIANLFTIYESSEDISVDEFLRNKNALKSKKLKNSVASLDFTTKTYFVHFRIKNTELKASNFYLTTARPITNTAELQFIGYGGNTVLHSGDAIPYGRKIIESNNCDFPIYAPKNETIEYVLKLKSDGEVISLQMVFSNEKDFHANQSRRQFNAGIFYGIFLFVILIYLTFYLLIRDPLYLIYSLYVVFSGLLQFSLDGYIHKYVFTSGGYLTQHSVLFIAGWTVLFALTYAKRYLKIGGRLKKTTHIFSILVLIATFGSLIPGTIYEISYPLINGFSLLSLIFLIYAGIKTRRQQKGTSRLFLIGIISLFGGAVIFILGNFRIIDYPLLTQNSLKAGSLIEIICLSILMAGKYKSLQDEKKAAQEQLMLQLEETNLNLEIEVAERTKEIEKQRALLKEKNKDFIASITYAERIQNAILPHEQKIKALLPDSFVVFKPKDIVSGDFYWVEDVYLSNEEATRLVVYATADCTGHGVPGAFVSIVCSNLLKLAKSHPDVNTPGQALDFVNKEINETLNSEYSQEEIRDGMDVAFCALDLENRILYFAGAKNGVTIIRNGEIIQYKGNRKAIGNTGSEDHNLYTTHEIKIEKNDIIYTFTDGIVDQFGGPSGKKFMSKRVRELLLSITHLPLDEQKDLIEKAFIDWKGDLEQIDDVLVIGVKI